MFAVRPARPGDAEAISAVAGASWHAAYDDTVGPEAVEKDVAEWYDPADLRQRAREARHFYVAGAIDDSATTESRGNGVPNAEDGTRTEAVGGEVVGLASGGAPDGALRDGVIDAVYVRPDRWRQGIGSKLVGALIADFGARAVERVVAVVLAENEVGRSFFASLGFREIDRTPSQIGGREREAIRLMAPLDEVTAAVESIDADAASGRSESDD